MLYNETVYMIVKLINRTKCDSCNKITNSLRYWFDELLCYECYGPKRL